MHQHLQPVGDDRRRLLARNAVNNGLASKPWVKTNMAPGSQVVSDYYEKAGLWPYLESSASISAAWLHDRIGNTGPLPDVISRPSARTTCP